MKLDALIRDASKLVRAYRVTDGAKFRLEDFDPQDTGAFQSADKPRAREALRSGVETLARLQDMLYAQNCWAVLLIFQAMDAAGKDSTIKHVMSGLNPQSCRVVSFKTPSTEELEHDYLWRCERELPRRGHIGIFNRSYYEEVLVARVHPEVLAREKLPPSRVGKRIWKERYQDIRAFERHLDRSGTIVRKFFLHVSRREQKRRFLERIDDPAKRWKFTAADVEERTYWKRYMEAYEDMVRATATPEAPWLVVPADHKWYTQIVVASVVAEALHSLRPAYPQPSKEQMAGLGAAKRALRSER